MTLSLLLAAGSWSCMAGFNAAFSGTPNLHASELSASETAIVVFAQGQPVCAHYDDLGVIEAASGGGNFGEPGEFASSVRRLKQSSSSRGGNAVIITEHKASGRLDKAKGLAIRCRVAGG